MWQGGQDEECTGDPHQKIPWNYQCTVLSTVLNKLNKIFLEWGTLCQGRELREDKVTIYHLTKQQLIKLLKLCCGIMKCCPNSKMFQVMIPHDKGVQSLSSKT